MLRATCDRSLLRQACRALAPALGSDLPIHACIHICASDGRLILEAQNGYIYGSWTCHLRRTADAGAVLIPGRILARFVEQQVAPELLIQQLDRSSCSVICDGTSLVLRCMPTEAWPRDEAVSGTTTALTETDLDQIGRVLFAVSHDDQRPVLKCVCIQGEHAFATDSVRLARARLSSTIPSCNLPGDFVRLVLRSSPTSAALMVGHRRAVVEMSDATWSTRLVEARSPSIDRFFSAIPHTVLEVDCVTLSEAIDRVLVFGSEVSSVQVESQEAGWARLSATHPHSGTADAKIAVAGDWMGSINVDASHLRDVIKAARVATLKLEISDDIKPIVIRSDGLDQLLMPRAPSPNS